MPDRSVPPLDRRALAGPGDEEPSGTLDLVGVERWRDQQDEALDAGPLERLPRARVRAQHALVEPREHRDDEARRVAAGGRVLVARALDEGAELRMEGLRVEAVRVSTGDGGHARTEAAHDDRRRGLGPQESRLPRPQPPAERDRVDHAPRAAPVALDRLPEPRRPR